MSRGFMSPQGVWHGAVVMSVDTGKVEVHEQAELAAAAQAAAQAAATTNGTAPTGERCSASAQWLAAALIALIDPSVAVRLYARVCNAVGAAALALPALLATAS
jgi:hypothetical protein